MNRPVGRTRFYVSATPLSPLSLVVRSVGSTAISSAEYRPIDSSSTLRARPK